MDSTILGDERRRITSRSSSQSNAPGKEFVGHLTQFKNAIDIDRQSSVKTNNMQLLNPLFLFMAKLPLIKSFPTLTQ